jgi:hypothetical protein
MGVEGRRRSWQQREKRERLGENAFIFDAQFTRCVGMVPRQQWEGVIAVCGGDIVRAATYCGVEGVPEGARALWGRTADQALAAYREWQHRKATGAPPKPRIRQERRRGRGNGNARFGRTARP